MQVFVVPPLHWPAWQVLPVMQRLESSHDSPACGEERQKPLPSHLPSSPQVTPEAAHALWATWPATTGRHWPAAPLVRVPPEQALQPVHATLQQTPSATTPEVHS